MNPFVELVITLLGIGVVLGQVLVVVWLLANIFFRDHAWAKEIRDKESRYALLFAFIIALSSTLGSLFLSDVANFNPCVLCWWQRVFMYPQTILLGMALVKKDKHVADYSLGLAIVGALIALYHYLLQLNIVPELPCSAVGLSATCSQRFVLAFDYLTIPLMSLTAYALIIISMISLRRKKTLFDF